MASSVVPTVALAHGAQIPRLGLGTATLMDDDAVGTIATAIDAGYRLLDTAFAYKNEEVVGRGLRQSSVSRGDVFVTTKFNRESHSVEGAHQAFADSARLLGIDYLDLMLIHWPNPSYGHYVEAWQGLIQLREAGNVRAIGTSNFKPAHIDRLLAETGEAPEVNQIELNPRVARAEARAYHADHAIVTESWGPLGDRSALLEEPVIVDLAGKYGKNPGQIVLRWHMDLGLVAIPRSSNPDRLRANLDIFDFSLTEDEVAAVSALDQGEAAATDSDKGGH